MGTARRDVLFGAAFAALGAGSYLLRPRRAFERLSLDALHRAIPEQVGDYRLESTSGLILPPADELSRKLYDQVLTRNYLAPGHPSIMALFAYGSTQNLTLQLHRPDECYPMQGFSITPLQPVPLRLGPATVNADLVTAKRPGRTEQVLFWSRIGDAFPADRLEETLLVAKENLRGRMPDGLLVRLSLIGPDHALALAVMTAFAEQLVAELPREGRRLLFGRAGGT